MRATMVSDRPALPLIPLLLCLLASSHGILAQPDRSAASARLKDQSVLLEVEGNVEVSRARSPLWDPARASQILLPGDRVRTGDRSRAVVRLTDRTVLRKGPQTIIEIPEAPRAGVRLLKGILYYFHRDKPRDFPLVTPACYAAIVGTEFTVTVAENGATTLRLLDGRVELTNGLGSLSLQTGEAGSAEVNRAPQRTAAIPGVKAVQWILYYPGVLFLEDLPFSTGESRELATSLSAYRAGDLLAALRAYPAGRGPASPAERVYLAGLLLAVGEIEPAQGLLEAVRTDVQPASLPGRLAEALLRLMAAVQLEPAPATGARSAPPSSAELLGSRSATEWLAESYVQQSVSRLEEARAAAERAVGVATNFAFAWVRLAEIEFSFGRIGRARAALARGLELAPRNAQAHALRGFLLAGENRVASALTAFDEALALDGALGNAWLGRGLCRIRKGDIEGGLQDLLVAATVEPQRAALRSYLGKAFQEGGDFDRARAELNLARTLDVGDPTPWLYAALLNQEENRINEAIRDLERSKEVNDNRSVYRSQLLLDQDRAVRGANLAGVYRDAGMTEVSVREAAQAIHQDYANYSAHLFLAESFNALREPRQVNLRYETPWFSEFLVASLLAPPGSGTLSPYVTQLEYGRLLERDGLGLASSTEYLSRGDWSQVASQHGAWRNTAYAADVAYRSENGEGPNQDLEDLALTLRFKHQITPQDSVFLQGTSYDFESGDVRQHYDPALANPQVRLDEVQRPVALGGYHHQWAPGSHTLLLAGWVDATLRVDNPLQQVPVAMTNFGTRLLDGVIPLTLKQQYRSELQLLTAEAQQIFQRATLTLIAGARYQAGDLATRNVHLGTNGPVSIPLVAQNVQYQTSSIPAEMERASLYLYPQWRVVDPLVLVGGLTYDYLRAPDNFRYAPIERGEETTERVSPKAGLIWTPDKQTAVRAAYARALGGVSLDQSYQLEPTQVAGFVQTYRSLIPESVAGAQTAPTFETWAVSLERKWGRGTYVGLAGEFLESEVHRQVGIYGYDIVLAPVFGPSTTPAQTRERLDFRERSGTLTLSQLVGDEWTFGAAYRISAAQLHDEFPELAGAPAVAGGFQARSDLEGLLHHVRLSALYQHPCGFFAQAEGLWFKQETDGFSSQVGDEDLWQFNLMAGYRFFHRRVEASLGLLNVTDRDYRLHPINVMAALPRERTLAARLRVYF